MGRPLSRFSDPAARSPSPEEVQRVGVRASPVVEHLHGLDEADAQRRSGDTRPRAAPCPGRGGVTSPLPSISRSVWVSIFFEMPGRLRCSTPVPRGAVVADMERVQHHARPFGREQLEHAARRAILPPFLVGAFRAAWLVTSWCLCPYLVPSGRSSREPA